jgi:hypothetical protein
MVPIRSGLETCWNLDRSAELLRFVQFVVEFFANEMIDPAKNRDCNG